MTRIPSAGVPSAGTSTTSKWWVIFVAQLGDIGHTGQNQFSGVKVINALNKAVATATMQKRGFTVSSVSGPYDTQADANAAAAGITSANTAGGPPGGGVVSDIGNALNPVNWLSSLGGMLGSGIESGFVSMIQDVWNVIVGPLEIIAGVVIAIIVLTIYFKNEIAGAAAIGAMLA